MRFDLFDSCSLGWTERAHPLDEGFRSLRDTPVFRIFDEGVCPRVMHSYSEFPFEVLGIVVSVCLYCGDVSFQFFPCGPPAECFQQDSSYGMDVARRSSNRLNFESSFASFV